MELVLSSMFKLIMVVCYPFSFGWDYDGDYRYNGVSNYLVDVGRYGIILLNHGWCDWC